MKPFIVFEGTDGAGTTTHSKAFVERLQAQGIAAHWTCEPTKSPVGVLIREFFERKHGELPTWRAMTMLFQADREIHLQEIRRMRETHVVVSDRYWLSTLVYQPIQRLRELVGEENLDEILSETEDWIIQLNESSDSPTATLVLDVSVEVAIERKNGDPDAYEDRQFREMSRKRYQEVGGNLLRLNTELPKDEVISAIDGLLLPHVS